MHKPLADKVATTVRRLRDIWARLDGKQRFVAFSTGKDSLALAAMLYEAVDSAAPVCLYAHHDLEFPSNLDYLQELEQRGFRIQVVRPFVEYFELLERGIGFLTLKDPWCVPMLVGTGILEWLQQQGPRSPRQAVMFRGMSGTEYSHKWHARVELYGRLDLPTVNPLLDFTKEEILETLKSRYALPLNPLYDHMDRSYCICCYTSDARRQAFSERRFPEVCRRYYRQIETMLFESGLIDKAGLPERFKSREEKLRRHGFVHWTRVRAQQTVGAIKRRSGGGTLSYHVREAQWIDTKHLKPLQGKWCRKGNEIRFWETDEKAADTTIKRMINCLDCGFCVVECFSCRHFDRHTKTLRIDDCTQCGKCLRLKFCMGWRHRFWRRGIVEGAPK